MKRVRILPDSGRLIINTDVHGNFADFEAVRRKYEAAKLEEETFWVILGDVVHGPSDEARQRNQELYDYDDRSFEIVAEIQKLRSDDPEHVIFVLGNHDHAHIGGPRTRKFHPDEADYLENSLGVEERKLMLQELADAALAVYAPCGLAMTHASPGREIRSLDEIESIEFAPTGVKDANEDDLLNHMLRCYGQDEEKSRAYLASISRLLPFDVTVVIHGHDRDPEGFFIQEETQFCPVIFGAPQNAKRYLDVDLSRRFNSPHDLRHGFEIRHLYER